MPYLLLFPIVIIFLTLRLIDCFAPRLTFFLIFFSFPTPFSERFLVFFPTSVSKVLPIWLFFFPILIFLLIKRNVIVLFSFFLKFTSFVVSVLLPSSQLESLPMDFFVFFIFYGSGFPLILLLFLLFGIFIRQASSVSQLFYAFIPKFPLFSFFFLFMAMGKPCL